LVEQTCDLNESIKVLEDSLTCA